MCSKTLCVLCIENHSVKSSWSARKLVSYFNRFVLATKTLPGKQLSEDPKYKPKKVIQDVMTR